MPRWSCWTGRIFGGGRWRCAGTRRPRHGIVLAKNEAAKAFGVENRRDHLAGPAEVPPAGPSFPPTTRSTATTPSWPGPCTPGTPTWWSPSASTRAGWDVTGTLHLFGGDPRALADRIREEMKGELGLTISVGVSFNKVFAKLGSDYKKPDATTVIRREDVPRMVWAPAGAGPALCGPGLRPGAGEGGHPHHRGAGRHPPGALEEAPGGPTGSSSTTTPPGPSTAPSARRGRPRSPSPWATASPSAGTWWGRRSSGRGAYLLAERVALRLRRHGLKCTTIQVALRSPEFKTLQRQKATPRPHQRLPGDRPVRPGAHRRRLAPRGPPAGHDHHRRGPAP